MIDLCEMQKMLTLTRVVWYLFILFTDKFRV